jgi:hypothetical protein
MIAEGIQDNMRKIEVTLFTSTCRQLVRLEDLIMLRLVSDTLQPLAETKQKVKDLLTHLPDVLAHGDLTFSLVHLQRLLENLARPVDEIFREDEHRSLGAKVEELVHRIDDELRAKSYFEMSADLVSYHDSPHLFGEQVDNAFPSVIVDIEEAGKCYAMARNTACVFHLMRVMEVGLCALGKSLNNPALDPRRNPSWDSILKKCDDELQKPKIDRSPEWQINDTFFSQATANLRAVKDAWRNPTMHVEAKYDNDKAIDVWNATRAFMRHLALKLTE